jgi:hypothetical protein
MNAGAAERVGEVSGHTYAGEMGERIKARKPLEGLDGGWGMLEQERRI